ncbi:predicted protein [Sclerotinia sclerotiorum 1980 UF-70]|uniref:Uncharacterized protein n=1 Tax=Sclerotinia sclerotiorum (strain ATCC 18683 / 1980 / Ss-1) TaxID=665079 RepID=A7F097_SCLS1|nr:predicted protein [Sclerotinia sclerotiorum 1980 UF-70]EDN95139.1 predicted protein [Sclerotinia sclerotiorum 1980 UF-70]
MAVTNQGDKLSLLRRQVGHMIFFNYDTGKPEKYKGFMKICMPPVARMEGENKMTEQ